MIQSAWHLPLVLPVLAGVMGCVMCMQTWGAERLRGAPGAAKNAERVSKQAELAPAEEPLAAKWTAFIGAAYEKGPHSDNIATTPFLLSRTFGARDEWYAEVSGDGYARAHFDGQKLRGLTDVSFILQRTFGSESQAWVPEIEYVAPTAGEVGSAHAITFMRLGWTRTLKSFTWTLSAAVAHDGNAAAGVSSRLNEWKARLRYAATPDDALTLQVKRFTQHGIPNLMKYQVEYDLPLPALDRALNGARGSWSGTAIFTASRGDPGQRRRVEFDLVCNF